MLDVGEKRGTWQMRIERIREMPRKIEDRIKELLEKVLGARTIIEVSKSW